MSFTLMGSIASRVKGRSHVRLYKATYLLLTLLSLAACATRSMPQEACYWPQSAATHCREVAEWNPRG